MLGKIIMLVVGMAVIASYLLAIRQSRLQTASEIVQAQIRINTMDERLAALRVAVSEEVSPANVRAMAADFAELVPLSQAAGDVAREQALARLIAEAQVKIAAKEATEAAERGVARGVRTPVVDPASAHNPDGSLRTPWTGPTPATTPGPTPRPIRSPSRTPSDNRNGGPA